MSSTRAKSIKQIALKNNLPTPNNLFPTSEIGPAKVCADQVFPAEYQLLKTGDLQGKCWQELQPRLQKSAALIQQRRSDSS